MHPQPGQPEPQRHREHGPQPPQDYPHVAGVPSARFIPVIVQGSIGHFLKLAEPRRDAVSNIDSATP